MKMFLKKIKDVLKVFLIGLILIAVSAGSPQSAPAKPLQVAVVPFKINAQEDLSFLRDGIVDMLVSRLSWGDKVTVVSRQKTAKVLEAESGLLNEGKAKEIGTKLGVDYVLFGSLTVFGQSVSMDAKMVDVSGTRPPLAFFNQSQGMDEVIPNINLFAQEINEKVFGRKTAIRSLPETRPSESPSIHAHPERQLAGGLVEQGSKQGDFSPFVVDQGPGKASGFWKSRSYKVEIKGLALGDVDGDEKTETILISNHKILVYRSENRRFQKIKEITVKSHKQLVAVDVADIKKDGRAEIFVTCLNTSSMRLESFVLEWNGKDFEHIAKKENWYFRVLVHLERGHILLGQKRGVADLFLPGVYELAWSSGEYVSINEFNLPKGGTVFGFALGDVMNDGSETTMVLDEQDYLRILTPSGKTEWKSDEQYGGSENYLADHFKASSEEREKEKGEEKRFYIPQRIFLADLNQDGQNEMVLVKNQATTGRLFKRFRRYTSTRFESLIWNGLGMAQNWHTRKVSGYCSDYVLGDFDNDGKPELVAAVVSKRGSVIQKAKSSIISYNLETVSEKPKTVSEKNEQ